MIESLESRLFCSATRYNLLTLIGYDNPGSNYKYHSSVSVQKNDLTDASNMTTSRSLTVRSDTSTTPTSFVAKTFNSESTLDESMVFTEANSQINLTNVNVAANGVSVRLTFSDTVLAPTSIGFNKKYSSSGTVGGRVSIDTSSQDVDGSVSGTTNTAVTLYGRKQITVRGTTYDAIEGAYTISVDGKLKFSKYGFSESGPVNLSLQETFYAVPNIGVVNDRQAVVVSGSISNSGNYTLPISVKEDLVSYVLGDNA